MGRLFLTVILTLLASALTTEVDEYNVPLAVQRCVNGEKTKDIELSNRFNPFFLRGDFDGDHNMDYAVLVTQRTTGKQGIVICLMGHNSPIVIGAGRMFVFEGGKQFDDLKSFDAWKVDDDTPAPKRASGERIHLIAKERGSGLIYWDGKTFRWEQLGI